jgi:hypothetical protein
MAKPDGRIEKGQRLSTAISARAWNRAQDAADIVLGAKPGIDADGLSYPVARNWLYARAASAINAMEWCLVDPSSPPPIDWQGLSATEQQSAKRSFHASAVIGDIRPARTAVASFSASWQMSHVVLALEPATTGRVIRVQVSGPVYAEINLRHRYHPAARLSSSDYETGFGASLRLESAMCGPLKIIWLDTRNYVGPVSGNGVSQLCPAIVTL